MLDDLDHGHGPRLWDATPGVCCAAFQLGACQHTEAPENWGDDGEDLGDWGDYPPPHETDGPHYENPGPDF